MTRRRLAVSTTVAGHGGWAGAHGQLWVGDSLLTCSSLFLDGVPQALVRGADGIAAFNMVHRSGVEGWMGPLAVHPAYQGQGIGKLIVSTGVEWLKKSGAKVIGLETMPRTMDNIGFYAGLGFAPGRLTITLTLDAALRTATGAAAYRAGERLRDERTGELYNYSRRQDVLHKEIVLPSLVAGNAPGWSLDSAAPEIGRGAGLRAQSRRRMCWAYVPSS